MDLGLAVISGAQGILKGYFTKICAAKKGAAILIQALPCGAAAQSVVRYYWLVCLKIKLPLYLWGPRLPERHLLRAPNTLVIAACQSQQAKRQLVQNTPLKFDTWDILFLL